MGAAPAKSDLEKAYRRRVSVWLQAVVKSHNLTQEGLAAKIGKTRPTVSRYISELVHAEMSDLEVLAANLGQPLPGDIRKAFIALHPAASAIRLVSDAEIVSGRSASATDVEIGAIRSMPIISSVAAGQLTDPSSQIEGEHQTIEISGLPPGDYFATRVTGTSMNRISPDGSMIIVNRAERDLIRGRRYVFARRGETTYKRYETNPLRLEPETTEPERNRTIFPRDDDEWSVVGRVRLTLLDDL